MSVTLHLFPARIAIGEFTDQQGKRVEVKMSAPFYRALRDVLRRLGGASSDVDLLQPLADIEAVASSTNDHSLSQEIAASPLLIGDLFANEMVMPNVSYPDEPGQPIISLAPVPSPMTYTALFRQAVHIQGGIITALDYVRGSSALALNPAANHPLIELNRGDGLRISYTAAPELHIIPR